MLDELVVRNLGLIEEAQLHPGPGLTVITGETGTGKTLLLGALRMLLGEGTKPDLVGPFGDEAVVEGRLVRTDGNEIGVARRMPRDGRSRAYLNGSIASAAALDEVSTGMVDIIGQHDQLSLLKPAEARRLVDDGLDDVGKAHQAAYTALWGRLQTARDRQAMLGGDRRAIERERDLADYQSLEIAGAGFAAGDDIDLERSLARMRNSAELGEHLGAAQRAVEQAREVFSEAVTAVRKVERLDASTSELNETLAAIEQSMGEVAFELGGEIDDLETDDDSLESAEARAATLADLKRKYGATLDDVLEFGSSMQQRSRELTDLLDSADQITEEIAEIEAALVEVGAKLRSARAASGDRILTVAKRHLNDLGFRDPVLEAHFEDIPPGPQGTERITLQFASDDRLKPGDLSKVASGGELSRLVLALRLAAGSGDTETLVFDEIDSGIGGTTAIEIGRKLAELATHHQILCVTHLPQVAAFADGHYVVDRGETRASVKLVEGDSRIAELSRMLAGAPDSDVTKRTAAELLTMAGRP